MAATATHYHHSTHSQQQQARACPASSSTSRSKQMTDVYDRFYGHRDVSELSESVITALFACPLDSSSSSVTVPNHQPSRPTPRLAEFIAYALHRTRLPDEITFQALFLLRRLKSRFPAAQGSSGHRLFISALMLASKSSCDDTYSNKSWTIVSQGLFSLKEVNQMERELFGYLGFKVNVEMEELTLFRNMLLAGDFYPVLDTGSPQASPNPDSGVESPSMERDCDTPTSAMTPSKSVSVDSAPHSHRHQAPRLGHRSSSISGYPAGVHTSTTSSPCIASASVPNLYARSGSVPFDRQHSFHTAGSAAAQSATHASAASSGLSPSSASVFSSRRSISSAGGSSMTPSPSSLSHSEASSGRNTPDTPPSELCSSPWAEMDGKSSSYSGEPAGTYDDNVEFYQHFKNQQYYGQQHQQQQQAHVYSNAAIVNPRARHPYT